MKIQKGIQLLRDFSLTCTTVTQEKVHHSNGRPKKTQKKKYISQNNNSVLQLDKLYITKSELI